MPQGMVYGAMHMPRRALLGRGDRKLRDMSERRLSVVVFALFSSWLLAFSFEGQILYALAGRVGADPRQMVFAAMVANLLGLLCCGLFIKERWAAKRLMLCSIVYCMAATGVFFFSPSPLWPAALLSSSFAMGCCVAAWGFYFQSGTPRTRRLQTAADALISSNLLMIALNVVAIHLSPYVGLGLSVFLLGTALLLALQLPASEAAAHPPRPAQARPAGSIARPLALLCLFIVVITINSGLMYQVLNPAYAHHESLASWYWALPYVAALLAMKKLPRRVERAYALYVAIAMIGFSFIAFMSLDRSAGSYLLVNTLMLGACGVYDLFWWSILGEMLDLHTNPARVLGIGLAANVFGVLLGGLAGNAAIAASGTPSSTSTLLALAVVCVTFAMLPLLHRQLSALLVDHAFLPARPAAPPGEQGRVAARWMEMGGLSERESQVATLLLEGKTYRMIASELQISENTVKYYVRNIYTKLQIQSRAELAYIMLKREQDSPPD
jgi:DNA-binding CsgD family transcriptional regulator